ncbi:unnamed protein product [Pedinophyceae sp. YPF-701]|nr:unnamed protein product [Pedinophyceae sp. YPF-701]
MAPDSAATSRGVGGGAGGEREGAPVARGDEPGGSERGGRLRGESLVDTNDDDQADEDFSEMDMSSGSEEEDSDESKSTDQGRNPSATDGGETSDDDADYVPGQRSPGGPHATGEGADGDDDSASDDDEAADTPAGPPRRRRHNHGMHEPEFEEMALSDADSDSFVSGDADALASGADRLSAMHGGATPDLGAPGGACDDSEVARPYLTRGRARDAGAAVAEPDAELERMERQLPLIACDADAMAAEREEWGRFLSGLADIGGGVGGVDGGGDMVEPPGMPGQDDADDVDFDVRVEEYLEGSSDEDDDNERMMQRFQRHWGAWRRETAADDQAAHAVLHDEDDAVLQPPLNPYFERREGEEGLSDTPGELFSPTQLRRLYRQAANHCQLLVQGASTVARDPRLTDIAQRYDCMLSELYQEWNGALLRSQLEGWPALTSLLGLHPDVGVHVPPFYGEFDETADVQLGVVAVHPLGAVDALAGDAVQLQLAQAGVANVSDEIQTRARKLSQRRGVAGPPGVTPSEGGPRRIAVDFQVQCALDNVWLRRLSDFWQMIRDAPNAEPEADGAGGDSAPAVSPQVWDALRKTYHGCFDRALMVDKQKRLKQKFLASSEDALIARGLLRYGFQWEWIQQCLLPPHTPEEIQTRARNKGSSKYKGSEIYEATLVVKERPLTPEELHFLQACMPNLKGQNRWNNVVRDVVYWRCSRTLAELYRNAIGEAADPMRRNKRARVDHERAVASEQAREGHATPPRGRRRRREPAAGAQSPGGARARRAAADRRLRPGGACAARTAAAAAVPRKAARGKSRCGSRRGASGSARRWGRRRPRSTTKSTRVPTRRKWKLRGGLLHPSGGGPRCRPGCPPRGWWTLRASGRRSRWRRWRRRGGSRTQQRTGRRTAWGGVSFMV